MESKGVVLGLRVGNLAPPANSTSLGASRCLSCAICAIGDGDRGNTCLHV